jgi:hypothetical protein
MKPRTPQRTPVKVCLVRRAAVPGKHPEAFDQLLGVLEKAHHNPLGAVKVGCKCNAFSCPMPKRHETGAMLDRLADGHSQYLPIIAKLFGR